MPKLNCWEFKKCGRQPNGPKAGELGVCTACTETKLNAVNEGKNGGRACWAIAGTLCGGKVQGSFAMKLSNCSTCDFYQLVRSEEGQNYRSSREILTILGKV